MIIFTVMLAIVVVGILIAGTIVSSHFKKSSEAETSEHWKEKYLKFSSLASRLRLCALIPVLIFILVMLFNGIKIIDETEKGVVRTFGEISGTVDSGLNFVNPLAQTVSRYDLRVHVREASFASYTKDAQPLAATIEYQYALNPAYVEEVAREYGTYEIMETKLANIVEEKAKVVFARYGAMTLLENRSDLSPEVAEEVRTIEELFNVTFTSVVIRDIDFSDAFEASVEAKMTAEQAALKAEQEKKTALVKAEQVKEVAAIEAEAAIAKAKGEAEAMRITREALQNMPEAYIQQMWIEKWNGELPTTQAGSDAAIIVNPN